MIRRASCPVACSVDRLGDRGTLLVTRDLFAGKAQRRQFCTDRGQQRVNVGSGGTITNLQDNIAAPGAIALLGAAGLMGRRR
jgi:hypothetical protein